MASASVLVEGPVPTVNVLMVDDDARMRELWRLMLEDLIPGVHTSEAGDGEEAVRAAHRLQPDVIIMDVAMPKLDGFEATLRLKGDVATSRIPIVAVTGRVFASLQACEAGCDAYLVKPVSPEALVREIERLLRRHVR